MTKGHLPKNSILSRPLIYWSNSLEEFIHSQNLSASLKDAENFKFKVCSPVMSRLLGVSADECVGLTIYDVGKLMHYKDSVVTHAMDIDKRISKGILPNVHYRQSIPIKGGNIAIEEVIKKPIVNKENKLIGLLASANDIAAYLDPFYLFSQYQRYYTPKEAIRYFCSYLEIQHFFYELPTTEELETLLIMRNRGDAQPHTKKVSENTKKREEYKARLKNNLKLLTLNELIEKLRVRKEFQDIES